MWRAWDGEDFKKTLYTVFCEPPVDMLFLEEFPLDVGETAFAAEYLPGQYDQRADSASQCIQLLTLKERPEVRAARVYVLSGEIGAGGYPKDQKLRLSTLWIRARPGWTSREHLQLQT